MAEETAKYPALSPEESQCIFGNISEKDPMFAIVETQELKLTVEDKEEISRFLKQYYIELLYLYYKELNAEKSQGDRVEMMENVDKCLSPTKKPKGRGTREEHAVRTGIMEIILKGIKEKFVAEEKEALLKTLVWINKIGFKFKITVENLKKLPKNPKSTIEARLIVLAQAQVKLPDRDFTPDEIADILSDFRGKGGGSSWEYFLFDPNKKYSDLLSSKEYIEILKKRTEYFNNDRYIDK